MTFKYFISAKNRLVVLSLKGTLDDKDGPALKRCLEDAISHDPGGVVLHLGELTSLPKTAFREFASFFRELKTKVKVVIISSLNPDAQKGLLHAGLISKAETKEELADAVKEVAAKIKGQKH